MAHRRPSLLFEPFALGRPPDDKIFASLKECSRTNRSVEIFYLSMNASRKNPRWRRVTPRAFCFDGFRWFMRAFCHIDSVFKDFVVVRCLKTRKPRKTGAIAQRDQLWNEYVSLTLVANPKLSRDQRRGVEFEYLLGKRKRIMKIRRSLLPYVNKRISLETARFTSGRKQAVLVAKQPP